MDIVTQPFDATLNRTPLNHDDLLNSQDGAPQPGIHATLHQDSFHSVLDALPDCAMLIEANGTVSYISPKGRCPQTLNSFDWLSGTSWISLYPEPIRQRLNAALAEAQTTGKSQVELEIPSDKGSAEIWLFQLSAVKGHDGTTDRILSVSRPLGSAYRLDARDYEADHRIKNSLSSVSSLLRLQARAMGQAEACEALQAAANRVMAIGEIHDRLQMPRNLNDDAVVSIRSYLEPLARSLVTQLAGRRMTLLHEIDTIKLPARQATVLGLVMAEAITQAVRRNLEAESCELETAQDGGLIHVSLQNSALPSSALQSAADPSIRLSVIDNGSDKKANPCAPSDIGDRIMDLYSRSIGATLTRRAAPGGIPGREIALTL